MQTAELCEHWVLAARNLSYQPTTLVMFVNVHFHVPVEEKHEARFEREAASRSALTNERGLYFSAAKGFVSCTADSQITIISSFLKTDLGTAALFMPFLFSSDTHIQGSWFR